MFSQATKDSANDVKNDVKSTVYNVKRDANAATSTVSSDLSDIANQAGRTVRGYFDAANDQITEATDKVTAEIRSNPVRSTLIALGAGFILGALSRR